MTYFKQPLRLLAFSLLAATSLVFSSCKKDPDPVVVPVTNTITDIVSANPNFTLLKAAVIRAGLANDLKVGTLTVFAPNDAAFKAAGFADVASIEAVPVAKLKDILLYHVLATKVPASAIAAGNNAEVQTLLTTNGKVFVSKSGSNVSVNGKKVITADVAADNGVIHIIDGVLMPPTGDVVAAVVADQQSFSLLQAAVLRAGIATTLTSATAITVFAPTNDAFIAAGFSASAIAAATPAALTKILTYHVVQGRVFSALLTDGITSATLQGGTVKIGVTATGVTVTGQGNGTNASTVVKADVLTTNAVIHVINRVLLPPP